MAAVNVTGEKLATLTATGQYLGTQGPTTSRHQFQLEKTGGQWRIENPPSRLLLAEPDFQRVYAPRNLYYVASSARALVPDPVFVPLQATPADLAGKLVTALLQNPEGWLASGVSTSFPRGATLRRVVLNDGTATIDLGGRAARATQENLNDMASQLVWTLAGPSYGQSVIRSVRLEVNGRPRLSASMSGGQSRPDGGSGLSVPTADKNVPLYAVAAATGAVQALTGPAREARTVPGEAGEGQLRLTTIAASPRGHYVAGISRSGKVVYYGRMQRGAGLTAWRPYGASAASLSWDVRGDLWVASSNGLWMLTPGTGSRMQVVPVGLSLRNGSEVSQLRVAPDGVRVAMIVHGPGGRRPRLLLAAIIRGPGGVDLGPAVSIGTDVSHPTQLTWYDADNLIVLSRSLDGPQLHEVAVNGSSAVPITTDAGTQSVTAAGRANPIVAGLAHGQLGLESSLNGAWAPRGGAFLSPVYPG
jgi:hypothetical protein